MAGAFANVAQAADIALTGGNSATLGTDDSDFSTFGGTFASDVTIGKTGVTLKDTYGSLLLGSPVTATAGLSFAESYTFDLTAPATSVSIQVNASPTSSVTFAGASYDGSSVISSPGSTGTDAFFTSGALTTGFHTFVFDVTAKASGAFTSITGNGTAVSAVPLPGAMALFGSGLFGVGALARRRKAVKAVKAAVLVALPVMAFAASPSAQAASVSLTDNIGAISTVNGLHATLNETVTSNHGGVASATAKTGGFAYNVASGELVTASYDFSLAANETLKLTETPSAGSTFALYKGTQVITPTHSNVSGSSSDTVTYADLSSGSYILKIVTDFAATKKAGTSVTVSGTVSAVPVPGALLLFGSGLAGLGLFGRRRRAV
jgi:hypothetical protein